MEFDLEHGQTKRRQLASRSTCITIGWSLNDADRRPPRSNIILFLILFLLRAALTPVELLAVIEISDQDPSSSRITIINFPRPCPSRPRARRSAMATPGRPPKSQTPRNTPGQRFDHPAGATRGVTRLGDFRIVKTLGEGSFGKVRRTSSVDCADGQLLNIKRPNSWWRSSLSIGQS